MNKYRCNHCSAEFNITNKGIESKLVKTLMQICPYCSSNDISLTKLGKLLVERKAKINKIENVE